jgi:ribose 5-phosphate isomerase B
MIALGSDHGGYELKKSVIEHLSRKGLLCKDYGVYTNEPADYPEIAKKVVDGILSGECDKGIVICGTGLGISMSANRYPGIRAALCCDMFTARLSRQHNDANVLALGGRVLGPDLAAGIVDAFLETPFSNEARHKKRIGLIDSLPKAQ